MVEVKVDAEKCTGCGTCVDTCPVEVFKIKENKKKISFPEKADQCLACRACEVQCPESAITITE